MLQVYTGRDEERHASFPFSIYKTWQIANCCSFQVADSTILACHNFTELEGKHFIDPIRDKRPGRVLPLHEQ
jgi:hypothetical protein